MHTPLEKLVEIGRKLALTVATSTLITSSLYTSISEASTNKYSYYVPVINSAFKESAPKNIPPYLLRSTTPILINETVNAKNITSTWALDPSYKTYDPKKDSLEVEVGNTTESNGASIIIGYKTISNEGFHIENSPRIYLAISRGTNIAKQSYKIYTSDGRILDGVPHSQTQINETAGIINRLIDHKRPKTENELPDLLSTFGDYTGTSAGIKITEGLLAGKGQEEFYSVQRQFPNLAIYLIEQGEIQNVISALRDQAGQQITIELDKIPTSANIVINGIRAVRGSSNFSQSQVKSLDSLVYSIQFGMETTSSNAENSIIGNWRLLFPEDEKPVPYQNFKITPTKITLRGDGKIISMDVDSIDDGKIMGRGIIKLKNQNPPSPFSMDTEFFRPKPNIIYFNGAYWGKSSNGTNTETLAGMSQGGVVDDCTQPGFGLDKGSGLTKEKLIITPDSFQLYDSTGRAEINEKISRTEKIRDGTFIVTESGRRIFTERNSGYITIIYKGRKLELDSVNDSSPAKKENSISQNPLNQPRKTSILGTYPIETGPAISIEE